MKRKRQNKIGGNFDPTKPITENTLDISKIGGEDDCFGKMHDPNENECKMCGDAGICLIMQGQLNRKKRLEVESKTEFRDIAKKPAKKKKKK